MFIEKIGKGNRSGVDPIVSETDDYMQKVEDAFRKWYRDGYKYVAIDKRTGQLYQAWESDFPIKWGDKVAEIWSPESYDLGGESLSISET